MSAKDLTKDLTKDLADLDHIINKYGLNYQDSEGESYLHEFARTGRTDLLYYLFDRERIKRTGLYNVNLKNKLGRTALYYALNEEICEFLILQRIDYKSKDNEGKLAEEVNDYANFIINQNCSETRKKLLKTLGLI